jgi:aryl-alcohol dehydrogenase-like predicted oxidoreductase
MEYRQLGNSGLKVPALAFGTATFAAGDGEGSWGNTQIEEASRLVDIALESGANLFDTADVYSDGRAEQVLGAAIASRRDRVLIGTKASFRGPGTDVNDVGSSRLHLTQALEGSLRRLGTDYVDIYYLHGYDAFTPQEEVLSTLDQFVRSGKVRYIGCSNFSGWQLMKSLSVSERYGWARHVAHQAYYSLAAREYEWELMPLAIDQNVGTIVWSPLAQGRLSGKIRRGREIPVDSRIGAGSETEQSGDAESLLDIVDVLAEIADETERTIPQVALNWVLQRPTVSSVIIGARNETQLRENLGALGWSMSEEQLARLETVSLTTPIYPYWHQRTNFAERNSFPIPPVSAG